MPGPVGAVWERECANDLKFRLKWGQPSRVGACGASGARETNEEHRRRERRHRMCNSRATAMGR